MALYQCEECGCVENTALGFYHSRNMKDLVDAKYEGRKLCSACGPAKFIDGSATSWGEWHGRFERKFYPKGTLYTDARGNIMVKCEEKT